MSSFGRLVCRATQPATTPTKKNEYVTITHGTAPNHHYSITTHGGGDLGYDNFHVYLMREPGHKKIGPLTEIDEILNTAPDAYDAVWSPDSRHVAILYRASRNVVTMNLYRVEQGRAFPVTGFDLVAALVKQQGASASLFGDDNKRSGFFEIKWQTSSRFGLKQEGRYDAPTDRPAKEMKTFGRAFFVSGKPYNSPDKYITTVSVDAVCQLRDATDTVQIVSTKPGVFTKE